MPGRMRRWLTSRNARRAKGKLMVQDKKAYVKGAFEQAANYPAYKL